MKTYKVVVEFTFSDKKKARVAVYGHADSEYRAAAKAARYCAINWGRAVDIVSVREERA